MCMLDVARQQVQYPCSAVTTIYVAIPIESGAGCPLNVVICIVVKE